MYINLTYSMIIDILLYSLLIFIGLKFLEGVLIITDHFLRSIYKILYFCYIFVGLVGIYTSRNFLLYSQSNSAYYLSSKYTSIFIVNILAIFIMTAVRALIDKNFGAISKKYYLRFLFTTTIISFGLLSVITFSYRSTFLSKLMYVFFILNHIIVQIHFILTTIAISKTKHRISHVNITNFRYIAIRSTNFIFGVLSIFYIVYIFSTLFNIDQYIEILTFVISLILLSFVIILTILLRAIIIYTKTGKNGIYVVMILFFAILTGVISMYSGLFYVSNILLNPIQSIISVSLFSTNEIRILYLSLIFLFILKIVYTYFYNSKNFKYLNYSNSFLILNYIRSISYIIIFTMFLKQDYRPYVSDPFLDVFFVILIFSSWGFYTYYIHKQLSIKTTIGHRPHS